MSEKIKDTKHKYVVVDVNGTQYKASEGDEFESKKLSGEKGGSYVSDKVLLLVDGDSVVVGKPYIEGAKVEFTIDSQKKGEKIDILKYKAKSRYRKTYGSRPLITRLKVKKIKTA